MVLKTTNGKDTYPMGPGTWFEWEVRIPNGISCTNCILQVNSIYSINKKGLIYPFIKPLIINMITSFDSMCSRWTGKLEIKGDVLTLNNV